MPVAYDQVDELYEIFAKYLIRVRLRHLLIDLKGTQAYHRNRSFHETIDRLEIEHMRRQKPVV
jgi:hypothetical protein